MLISELPRVVRNMANANKRRQNGINCKYDNLISAFDWHITPEGYDFWSALNMKFIIPPANKHGLPRGVRPISGKYLVEVRSIDGHRICSRFKTPDKAELFWLSHRVNIIKELAEKYKKDLSADLYNKLINIK